MDTPKFVGVVFTGKGEVLRTFTGDTEENVVAGTLAQYTTAYSAFAELSAPGDPPQWEVFKRTNRSTPLKRWVVVVTDEDLELTTKIVDNELNWFGALKAAFPKDADGLEEREDMTDAQTEACDSGWSFQVTKIPA